MGEYRGIMDRLIEKKRAVPGLFLLVMLGISVAGLPGLATGEEGAPAGTDGPDAPDGGQPDGGVADGGAEPAPPPLMPVFDMSEPAPEPDAVPDPEEKRCIPVCQLGEKCVDGQCEPTESGVESREPHWSDRETGTADSIFTVHSNLLGAAQWGLTLGLELGTKYSAIARVRTLNVGVWPYLGAATGEIDWGIGAAAGFRWYTAPGGNLRGFFMGAAVEYFHVEGERAPYTWTVGYLGPEVELGYRWIKKHFLVGVGIASGGLGRVFRKRQYWYGVEELEPWAGGTVSYTELVLEMGVIP